LGHEFRALRVEGSVSFHELLVSEFPRRRRDVNQQVKVVVQNRVRENLNAAKLPYAPKLIAPHFLAFVRQPIPPSRDPRDAVVNSIRHLQSGSSHLAILLTKKRKCKTKGSVPKVAVSVIIMGFSG
jgi:hypothetical protein